MTYLTIACWIFAGLCMIAAVFAYGACRLGREADEELEQELWLRETNRHK